MAISVTKTWCKEIAAKHGAMANEYLQRGDVENYEKWKESSDLARRVATKKGSATFAGHSAERMSKVREAKKRDPLR